MSDPSTPPSPAGAPASADAAPAQESGKGFEDIRKKIVDQLTELGHHVDGLSQKLTDAAGQARQVIERELSNIKAQHPETFARLDELRHTGDESLDILRGRLDKLAGELEKAVNGFLGTLAEQAKKVTTPHAAEGAASPSADSPASATHATPAAPPADKPQN